MNFSFRIEQEFEFCYARMKALVFLTVLLSIFISTQGSHDHGIILDRSSLEEVEFLLQSTGYSIHDVCQSHNYSKPSADFKRMLGEESSPTEENVQGDIWYYITNGGLAFVCVTVAALAAGLTMVSKHSE